ncbi:MAG: hypothetical protein JW869_04525 [Candidatus Omnitrophica bacterium]|nr:hypothetical protein [Candidatus Omnitrophota bacterium]
MQREIRDKKGIILVSCYFVIATLAVLGSAFLARSVAEKRFAERQRASVQAFYVAEAGLERAVWFLTAYEPVTGTDSDGSWRSLPYNGGSNPPGPGANDPQNEPCGQGDYTIWVEAEAGNTVVVHAEGMVGGINRVLRQRGTVIEVPEAFDYAAYVGGQINGDITVNGDSQENGTELPTVDMTYYSNNADHNIVGNHNFPSGVYNGMWYVDGSVTFDNNVTINGSIISTGGISTNGNSNISIIADLPNPALVAEGNFNFQNSANVMVDGLIYVGSDLTGNFHLQQAHNIVFTGVLIVGGNLNCQNSDVTVNYDPAIAENPPPGFTDGGRVVFTEEDWQELDI